ncbi:MAG: hypothetical protein ACOC1F_06355 [Myxococcota bacterium]
MQAMFTLVNIAFFLAVAFITVAALVTAVRCNNKPGNKIGAWILFLGCLIGAFPSFGYLVMALLPSEVLFEGGLEFIMVSRVVLGLINVLSTAVMVVGIAAFRPLAAQAQTPGGAS